MTRAEAAAGGVERIVDALLAAEGWPVYTDDPVDRGGPTKGGVTLATLSAWRGEPVTTDDLQALDEQEARAIYAQQYAVRPRFVMIDDALLRWQVVDAGVLSGPSRAARWLQASVGGVTVDGAVGPRTLEAVNAADPHVVAVRFAVRRIRFLGDLIERDRTQTRFADGWMTRATSFLLLEVEATA